MMNGTREDKVPVDTLGEEVILLGIASLDTQGGPFAGEDMGGFTPLGITQD